MSKQKISFFILIVFLGALIRFVGLSFDFPKLTKPDEDHVVEAVDDRMEGKSVGKYGRPDRTIQHLNVFARRTLAVFGMDELNLQQRYYIGRFISFMFGVLSIVIAFYIGEQFKNKCGLLFAFACAFSPLLVQNSRFVTPELANYFFTLCVVLASILYVKKRQNLFLALAVLSCALNTAAKYPAVLCSLVIGLAIFFKTYQPEDIKQSMLDFFKYSVLSFIGFVVCFLIVFPELVLDFDGVVKKLTNNAHHVHTGVPELGFLVLMKEYFYYFLLDGGVLYLLVAILGAYYAWKLKEHKFIFFLAIGLLIQVFLSAVIDFHMMRYSVIMVVTPLFFWAYGSSAIISKLRETIGESSTGRKSIGPVALCLCVLISSLFFVTKSTADTMAVCGKHTSFLLEEYGKENGVTRKNSLFGNYTFGIRGYFRKAKLGNLKTKNKPYIVVASKLYNRYYDERHGDKYSRYRRFYDTILGMELIHEIKPTDQSLDIQELMFTEDVTFNYIDLITIGQRTKFILTHLGREVVNGPRISIFKNKFNDPNRDSAAIDKAQGEEAGEAIKGAVTKERTDTVMNATSVKTKKRKKRRGSKGH